MRESTSSGFAEIAARRRAVWVAGLVIACAASSAAAQAPGPETLHDKAAKLYATATSLLKARKYDQAEPVLAKYLKLYSTHEQAVVVYMQLANCRAALKDFDGYEKTLREMIRRYGGSPAWFAAHGALLARAKKLGDRDNYLLSLENMLQRLPEAPMDLRSKLHTSWRSYYYGEFRWGFGSGAARMGGFHRGGGWVMDLLWAADTPERAERVVRALRKTLTRRKKDLPADWQFAHVELLRRTGKDEEASAAWDAYVKQWQGDPRGVDLWLLEWAHGPTSKDPAKAQALLKRLTKDFPASGALRNPVRKLLGQLNREKKYDQFASLARYYITAYSDDSSSDYVIGWWAALAGRFAGLGDTSKVDETLKMLEGLDREANPFRRRTNLQRRIDLLVAAKRFDQAAELGMKLIDKNTWCAESWQRVTTYSAKIPAFAKVEQAARTQWKIPRPNPKSPAAAKLAQLRKRLADDQDRHAEEIGEEMFSAHRDDAATIKAVKLLADYHFKKVQPELRDKWLDRMIGVHHYHPLTQAALERRITAENAASQYDRLAKAVDTIRTRFPGNATSPTWLARRLACFNAANDREGQRKFVRAWYQPMLDAGDILGRSDRQKYDRLVLGDDHRSVGDWCMKMARTVAGKRQQLHYLERAFHGYYWTQYAQRNHGGKEVLWDKGLEAIEKLQAVTFDPEVRWAMAFADINLLAQKEDGAAALKAIDERVKDKSYRDLSERLDLPAVGAALGKAGKVKEGMALAARLRKACWTRRDAAAIELMLGAMHAAAGNKAQGAKHYLSVVYGHPTPSRMYLYARSALSQLKGVSPQAYVSETERYIRTVGRTEEIVAELLYGLGDFYLGLRSPGVNRIRSQLASRFAASSQRDKLEKKIARLQKR